MMSPEKFKRMREKLGFTQVELAYVMEQSQRTIQRWENGETPIPALAEFWMKHQITLI